MKQPPLIRVVDDDQDVREALGVMLACQGYEVRLFPDGESFLAAPEESRAGCVLLDVRMPGLDGPEVQRRIRAAGLRLPVVFLTSFAEVETAVAAVKEGAEDFLIKPVPPVKLLAVIRAALANDALQRAAGRSDEAVRAAWAQLTDRPRRVLLLMLDGLKSAEIAERLGLSERTVQVYRQQIHKSFGVHSAKELEPMAETIRSIAG